MVLLTHLVNVWLPFRLVEALTGSAHLAAFGAVLRGTSPLDEGSLGWYSAYGHVLVASALLVRAQLVVETRPAQARQREDARHPSLP